MNKPSLADRFRVTVERINHAFWILTGLLVLSLGLSIYTGHWSMWSLTAVCAALAVWVPLYKGWIWGGGLYEIKPLRIQFDSDAVYHEKAIVKEFIYNKWWPRWKSYAKARGYKLEQLLQGVTVKVTKEKPVTPQGKEVIGMTYPDRRDTTIWGPELLNIGAFGHELDLQAAHIAWGPKPEKEDIRLLKEHGIKD